MDTATRSFACLDMLTPRPAYQLGFMVWSNQTFNSQQVAGAVIQQVLETLERQGLAQCGNQGWARTVVQDDE